MSCLKVSHALLNVLDVGKLSKSLVSPNLLTLVAYPVLYVTVLVTGSFLSLNVLSSILKSRDCKVLIVGYHGACCIKVVYVTGGTVPILGPAGVVTAGSDALGMNNACSAGRSNLNVLDVGKLSKSLVSPNLLTIVAYPVLYVTVLGAGRSLCRYILCRVLKCSNGKVLVVSDNGAC